MVHLVLKAGGEKPFECLFVVVAVQVLIFDRASRGAIHIGINLGNRQAAFVISRHVFGRIDDHRINEDARLFLGRGMGVFVPIMLAFNRIAMAMVLPLLLRSISL